MKIIALRLTAPILALPVVLALIWPAPTLVSRPTPSPKPTFSVAVAATDLQLVCPGALLRLGGTDGTDPDLRERIGEAEVAIGSAVGRANFGSGPELEFQSNLSLEGISSSATLSAPSEVADQGSTSLTATQYQSAQVSRMQGLATSGCIQPTAESRFVAGSAAPGSESLLMIVNPSVIATTVTVTAHLAAGETRADQIVLPAGETRLFQLEAILQGESEFSLQVTASQGRVAAFLQQRETSGLSALGVDLVTPATSSNQRVVVPGILVRGSEYRLAGEVGNWLRVFNPGEASAEVLIELVGSATGEFGGVLQATVSAKNTVDIPLAGLTEGTYAAFVSSDQPIMAGAFSRGAVSLEAQDIAWSQSAVSQDASFAFGIPAVSTGLQLTNPGAESVTLSITDSAGTTAIVLPAKSTRLYPAATGFLRVDASSPGVVANLVVQTDLGFGVVALGLNKNFGSDVLVEVGN